MQFEKVRQNNKAVDELVSVVVDGELAVHAEPVRVVVERVPAVHAQQRER